MDEQAFIAQATHFRQTAVTTCLRQGMDVASAEDIAQETMIRLWQMLDLLADGASATAFATRIARNMAIDRHRQASRRQVFPLGKVARLTAGQCPDERLEDHDNEAWLRRKLRALPTTEHTVLRMRQVEGLSNREIARHLGLKEESVSTLLARARRKLLEQIKAKNRGKR